MALQKFLALVGGRIKEILPVQSSAGQADAGKVPALNESGKIDDSMLPVADVKVIVASETLAAGDLVNIWNDGGTAKMRKADATTEGKEAIAFVREGVALGASGRAYFDGHISGLSGLTAGNRYFLSATAGGITDTAPAGEGNVVQFVGVATSATELAFEPSTVPVTVTEAA